MWAELEPFPIRTVTLLWGAAAIVATVLLAGAMSRRREGLTETLREYVRREQQGEEATDASEADPVGDRGEGPAKAAEPGSEPE